MIKLLTVFGTRPEAIKMAPVILELKKTEMFDVAVCATAQHRQMLDVVLGTFNIGPDCDLDLMIHDQSLSHLSAQLLKGLDGLIKKNKPDWILAQGDTTTAMVVALVSYYNRIKFGHIEAGLRTGNIYSPFPEEANRRIVDMLSEACFAPTQMAFDALIKEGFSSKKVFLTGNTVIDALFFALKKPCNWGHELITISEKYKRIVLITAHRRESFGAPFETLCQAIKDLCFRYQNSDVGFIYPVHPNPNVRTVVLRMLSGISNLFLVDPLEYVEFVHLMKRSYLILTDSGGVQEEAPSLKVPVLVMRDVTERMEGVDLGAVKLVGTDRSRIVEEVSLLLDNESAYKSMICAESPYGDGFASKRIVDALINFNK